jgi:RNA polymerase sigma factor (sigma-70 family)
MPISHTSRFLRRLRGVVLAQDEAGMTDGQLLGYFVEYRDEAAFEALLRRHGPMVLGVCRRLLGNTPDAEDAFQASFLVFVRKAASIAARDALGGWLHGVAYRTALEARGKRARRRAKEKQVEEMPEPPVEPDDPWRELQPLLDQELNRLPDKYRVPVVLCDLEGKTRKEAARILGVPEGTLSWRLAQAKKLLAKRLSRHGTALSGGALAAVPCRNPISTGVPHPLLTSTAKAGMAVAAGQAGAAGAVSAKVLVLAEGVMKAMLLSKLKAAAWVGLLAACVGSGVAYRAAAQVPARVRVESALAAQPAVRPAPDDLEALRLEIEALRKEMRAMRERMRALETEVRGQKGAEKVQRERALYLNERAELEKAARLQAEARAAREQRAKEATDPVAQIEQARRDQVTADLTSYAKGLLKKLHDDPNDKEVNEALNRVLTQLGEVHRRARPNEGPAPGTNATGTQKQYFQTLGGTFLTDPLADAEAALQKLRATPDDKGATESLERALKRLREERNPNKPARPENPRKK